jgi:phage tail-like protein
MAASARGDPYLSHRYLVEIDGLVVAGFSEVSGLQIQMDPEEYREGGLNHYSHRLPTRFDHSNVVLERGLTDSTVLWEWFRSTAVGHVPTIQRRNVRVILLDAAGAEALGWELAAAYPIRWTGPELRGDQGAVGIEAVELAHRGLTLMESFPP